MENRLILRTSINDLPTETLIEVFDIIQESTKHPTQPWYYTPHDPRKLFPWGPAAVCVRWFNILTEDDHYWRRVGEYEDGEDAVRPGITILVDLPTATPPYLPQLLAACPRKVKTVQLLTSSHSNITPAQEQRRTMHIMRTLRDLSVSGDLDCFNYQDSALFLLLSFRSSLVAASQFIDASWNDISDVRLLGLVAANADFTDPLRIGGGTVPTFSHLVDIVVDARSFMSLVPYFEDWTAEAGGRRAGYPQRVSLSGRTPYTIVIPIGVSIAAYLPYPPVAVSGVRRREFMRALGDLSSMRKLVNLTLKAVQFDEDINEHVQPPMPLLGPDRRDSLLDVKTSLCLKNSEYDNGALVADTLGRIRYATSELCISKCALPSEELLASALMRRDSMVERSPRTAYGSKLTLTDIDSASHGDMRPVLARWSGQELHITDCPQIPDDVFDAMAVKSVEGAPDVVEARAELTQLDAVEYTTDDVLRAHDDPEHWVNMHRKKIAELKKRIKARERAFEDSAVCPRLRSLYLSRSNFSWDALRRMLKTRHRIRNVIVHDGPPVSEETCVWFKNQYFSFEGRMDNETL
ncbi:hypothetical protein CONPUDRAFT_158472 [Coniophora puteana RWD-64-598 SS2]|uniref:F-box domain-containing protein n=1 Tax=Coniophora puteana (strain RWD-64-598) TaxID=741705 RepID=A0A5M3MC18_CONPW|nr:uncharacterized protein CONPUDRAFT_158472 [Coniophora puteana RWD-64-598 SS2]EIW76444.1 hypothetical protein CONPUDRAFT_158472 [Coniophora puteana RWD-64-598 SS2]